MITEAPEDADRAGLVDHLSWQARGCAALGSPFYARILERLAEDVDAEGPTAAVLRGHGADSRDVALGLRLLGGVHRLVLGGGAPALARHFPSAGGDGDADAVVDPLLALFRAEPTALRATLDRPPQTNEVGRSASLLGALHHLVAAHPLPVRLVELGASAGLNLRVDHVRVGLAAGRWVGPADSPVVMPEAWLGDVPPVGPSVEVVERLGCDPYPLDPTDPGTALALRSYVWPDQDARLARLAGALQLAAAVPATVQRSRALDLVRSLAPVPGTWLVVWHSVMWQYVDAAEQRAVLDELARLGSAASSDAPLAHVALEPRYVARDELTFLVTVETWPDVGLGAGELVLGRAPGHGVPVQWADQATWMAPARRAHG